ncbi:MAG: hypothetical protein M3328_12465, partial [Chloroflexota bacterium]|nr:hypothetical protein [Chloroflexota bacterium]
RDRLGWWGWGALAGLVICLLLLLIPMGRFVESAAAWLDYPYPRPGSEGLILYESLLTKRGGDIYSPITPERFISGPYPPVYYWLAAALLPEHLPDFSGPGAPASIFREGRILSLLSALLTAAIVPLIVIFQGRHHRSRQKLMTAAAAGLAGSLAFLSLPQTAVWATRFRGDMLMLAFTAAGLLCIALGVKSRQPAVQSPPRSTFRGSRFSPTLPGSLPILSLGAAFFSLAFYTKQTALAGPVAAAVYLLLRDWRAGLRWCLVMGAAVLVPFALLDFATGHWFFLKMVSYHSLRLSEVTLTRLLQFAFWEDQWPLVLVALGYTVSQLVAPARAHRTHEGRQAPSLVALFVTTSFLFLPSGAVIGADHNHLLLPGLAVSLAVGAVIARSANRLLGEGVGGTGVRALAVAYLAATLLALAVYATVTSPPSSWYNPDLDVPSAQVQEQYRKIVYNVSQNPGTLFFSDDPGIVALAGKETPYDDPFTMTALAASARWDEAAYRTMLREGGFGLLVLSCDVSTPRSCRADTFTPGVLDAISDGYRVLFRDVMYTYAPREAAR